MSTIARTSIYHIKAQCLGTLVTRLKDNHSVYFQPGEDETLFLDSVFGINLPEEVDADAIDTAVDEYADLFQEA